MELVGHILRHCRGILVYLFTVSLKVYPPPPQKKVFGEVDFARAVKREKKLFKNLKKENLVPLFYPF